MMQIQTKIEQSIHDYIRDAPEDPTKKDIINHFKETINPETVEKTLQQLRIKDIIILHKDQTYTLNNPDFDSKKHDWVTIN